MTIDQVKTAGTNFWDWVDRRTVFRRSIIAVTLYMTFDATRQLIALYHDAVAAHADLTGTALCLGAIAALPGAVQKFAFDIYNEARKDKEE